MTKTNILLVTSDQQHFSTLGSVNKRIRTPALDRLCDEGVRFTRAYCTNPTCTPSRASMITGMYPSQHGAWALGTKLFEDVPTIGDYLRQAGYFTALVGKAHFQPLKSLPGMESLECQPLVRDLAFWRDFHGPWYGFEHVETARMHACEYHVGQHYAIWMEERGLKNWRDYFEDWPPDEEKAKRLRSSRRWALPEEFHYSTWTGERTMAQIDRAHRENRPFFIWASFHDPHPPYLVPDPWAGMYTPDDMVPGQLIEGEHDRNPKHFGLTQETAPDPRGFFAGEEWLHGAHSHRCDREELKKDMACYYGMVSFMDREIGRILGRLDALGLTDNTLVVFSTDHGHFLGQHGLTAKALHHYEDLLRVPFVVRWPGRVPCGRVSESIQNLMDLAPTFAAVAGLKVPRRMSGVNQLETWAEGVPARHWSITENHHGPRHCNLRSFVTDRYKITVYATMDEGELFDLRDDPDERNNLWHERGAQTLKQDMLLQFMQACMQSESLPMPRIACA